MKYPEAVAILATTIFLAGCGGGSDGGGSLLPVSTGIQTPAGNAPEEVKTPEAEDQKGPEAVPIPDPQGTHKTSSWIDLSPESKGISTFQKSSPESTADGIVVNVEGDFEQHRSKVVEALEQGMVVVLDSSGSESAQLRIQALSFELAQIGAKAAAVMLYKGGPEENISLLAFGADEKSELAALMKQVGRRGSEIKQPE